MRRDEIATMKKGSAVGLQEKLARKNKFRSASDIGTRGSRNTSSNITEESSLSPKDSPFDIVLEPIGRSSTGRWSKTSSPLVAIQSDLSEPSTNCSPDLGEGKEGRGGFMVPTTQSSHYVSQRQTDISDIPLNPSAAFFYNGPSQQMEVTKSCEGVYELNMYLKARRAEVNAGVPGMFLHAVIGPDVAGNPFNRTRDIFLIA